MIDLQEEENRTVKCVLVGEATESNQENSLLELHGLIKTLGYEDVSRVVLQRRIFTPQYGIGTGKAQEIVDIAKENEADCIVFDFEISPTQQRNWEKLANKPVLDRQEVIIRIFATRARTKEAFLQVELARLTYSLPRLAHSYGDMAKQRGGSYGAKGSGETQLELDKRGIQKKIEYCKHELKQVVKERETNRRKREKIPLPTCALVGYTNVGKSSLLNALTGSGVFVEDKLFATLDPTTRKLSLEGGNGILLTDTVGFISNLPHTLVDAFKSTLEEASRANLLLLVLDASDENCLNQLETVNEVLQEIGAEDQKRIIVLNKVDVCTEINLNALKTKFEGCVCVSAKTKEGFAELSEAICEALFGKEQTFYLPLDCNDLLNEIRKTGILCSSEWQDTNVVVKARVSGKTLSLLEQNSLKEV